MIFYNFFPNINNDFKLIVKYNNSNIGINFKEGAYSISDISNIINLKIKENSNIDIGEPIKMVVDINQYKILIIVKNSFKLILDKNFMKLLGFSKYVLSEGYHRCSEIPQVDRMKYLKIYCDIVNNKNENEFLSNIFIKNGIGDLVVYDNFNIYKKQKILESDFNFIEVCVKNQDNKNIELKDFWQYQLILIKIYEGIK